MNLQALENLLSDHESLFGFIAGGIGCVAGLWLFYTACKFLFKGRDIDLMDTKENITEESGRLFR